MKDTMSLHYMENEPSIQSTALNSVYPEQVQFFLLRGLSPWKHAAVTPSVYCKTLSHHISPYHAGTCLHSQHLGSKGWRIEMSTPAGATKRDPISKQTNPSISVF
jgi:hypothetical protein